MKQNKQIPCHTDKGLEEPVKRIETHPEKSRDYFNAWTHNPQQSLAADLKRRFPQFTTRHKGKQTTETQEP